jgi:hypothetical protein
MTTIMSRTSTRLLAGVALVLAGVGLALYARRPRGPALAEYHLDARSPGGGEINVTLRLSGAPASVELSSRLGDDLVDCSGFRIEDQQGRPVPFTFSPAAAGAKDAASRYVANSAGGSDVLTVRYEVHAAPYWPRSGAQEFRQSGVIGADGAALSLPGFLLLPSCPVAETRFSMELPDGWTVVEAPGAMLSTATPELWRASLVAGKYRVVRRPLVANLELSVFEKSPEGAEALVAAVVDGLARALGEPSVPVHVVLAPWSTGELPVELPGQLHTAIVDLRDTDPESVRSLVRALVPRWFGRTPAEIEGAAGPESWFPLGLVEYLALTLPVKLGIVERDAAASIEWAWMQSSRRVSIVTQVGDAVEHKLVRRDMATALVHELARTMPENDLERALLDFDGTGNPGFASEEASKRFASFLATNLQDGANLSFEGDWQIDLEHRPATRPPTARVERVLKIAFTSDTHGYIEGCGCKLAQSGGIAHRAEALRALRAKDPQLLLLDLGNFSPIKAGRARLDALTTEEYRFYLSSMEGMSYEAACVGPGELYSGFSLLREASAARTPFLGLGIEIQDEAPFDSHVVLKKNDLRIGVIGFSELLEPGLRFQAQERNMAGVHFPTTLEALDQQVRELRPEVDLLIVAGRMQPRTLREVCAPGRGVDLVLLGGFEEYRFMPGGPSGFLNDTAVACHQIAAYGYSLVTLYVSAQGAVEVQLETKPLMRDEPIHPDTQRRIDRFYREIGNKRELLADMEPLLAWDAWQRGTYVGAEACRECHVEQHDQWLQTPHARAMETLVTAGRSNSPKCVQCHVVGFESESGFRMAGTTPHLAGVQCEVCHGAGAEHAKSAKASDIRRTPPARLCFECHDKEHAESFSERLGPALESVRH